MAVDFKSFGDAQQAGWSRQKSQAADGSFLTVYELHLSQDRQSGHALRITANAASGGEADRQALDAVNGWRRARYGYDDVPEPNSMGPRSGQELVPDLT